MDIGTHVVAPIVAAINVKVHDIGPILQRGNSNKREDSDTKRSKVKWIIYTKRGDADDSEDVTADDQQSTNNQWATRQVQEIRMLDTLDEQVNT
eukprot:SAG31_NODE_338_length_17490_cov_7.707032_7_plen_94_part_00